MKIFLFLLGLNLGFLCGCAWSHRGGVYGVLLALWSVLLIAVDLLIQFGLDIAGLFRWLASGVASATKKLLHKWG